MTKLSDTQTLILHEASQRPEHLALPLPANLRGGAASKVVAAMLAKGLLQEVDANLRRDEPVWRSTGDGHGTTLIATDVGLAAINYEKPDATETMNTDEWLASADSATQAHEAAPAPDAASATQDAPKARTPRTDTKQALLIAMLERPQGCSVAEVMAGTSWLAHTVRGAMAGVLKKKLGMQIGSAKEEGRGRVYRSKPAAKEV